MRPIRALALILAVSVTAQGLAAEIFSPWSDGRARLGLDLSLGTPSGLKDVFRSAFPGVSLRYLATRNFEFSLDYAYLEMSYYYPTSPSGPWAGPVPWSSVPASFSGMRTDWLFYQTRHFLAPQAWYVGSLEEALGLPLDLRVGLGPALTLVVPSEALKYYPSLADAVANFSSTFKAYLGLSFHAGLGWHPTDWFRLGAEYLFVVDSPFDVMTELWRDPLGWVERSGNLVLTAGVRL